LKHYPSTEIISIIVVSIALLSIIPNFAPASGVTIYSPGAKKGEWVYYGQISTYFQSNIGITTNPFITPFEHVASINSTVTDVTQDNITISQLWTFNNGTSPETIVLQGNVATGDGNYSSVGFTYWFLAGGLSAGDGVGAENSPAINDTLVANYAGSPWAVNLWNFTLNTSGVQQVVPYFWEENTGLLLEHTYLLSFPNYETGSLEIKATQTNIPTTNPDFAMTLSSSNVATMVNTTATTTLTLSSQENLTVSLTISSSPSGLSCSLSASDINIKGSTNSTLACKGPAGTYRVTLSGSSGTQSHTKTLTYQVSSPAPTPATILGLNPIIFYATIAAIVAVGIVTTAVLLRRRKTVSVQAPPTPQPPSETPAPPVGQPPAPPTA
jgi:hypothetical protein